jgi:preprotein translocase subunit Sec63
LVQEVGILEDVWEEGTNAYISRTYFLIGGWTVFGLLSWKAVGLKSVNKIYDPFEILGVASVSASFYL